MTQPLDAKHDGEYAVRKLGQVIVEITQKDGQIKAETENVLRIASAVRLFILDTKATVTSEEAIPEILKTLELPFQEKLNESQELKDKFIKAAEAFYVEQINMDPAISANYLNIYRNN